MAQKFTPENNPFSLVVEDTIVVKFNVYPGPVGMFCEIIEVAGLPTQFIKNDCIVKWQLEINEKIKI